MDGNVECFTGAETTSSSLLWAFLFLLHHPEVQTRVQAEIDSVVEGRNVSLEDKASLPYTNAVLMESMRLATIVPNALPHSAMEDIEYNGYIIPKVLCRIFYIYNYNTQGLTIFISGLDYFGKSNPCSL